MNSTIWTNWYSFKYFFIFQNISAIFGTSIQFILKIITFVFFYDYTNYFILLSTTEVRVAGFYAAFTVTAIVQENWIRKIDRASP